MGRLSGSRIPRFARVPFVLAAAAAMVAALSMSGCENSLQSYLFKYLFYDGWMIDSWTEPAFLVDGETHEAPEPPDLSNGFPMGMAVGDNGRVHVIGHRVSEFQWVYTRKSPDADRFDQAFTVVADAIRPGATFYNMPHVNPVAGDSLMIAYSDEVFDGIESDHLIFQEYVDGSGWKAAEDLYGPGGPDITQAFVFFMTADYKPHLFYVSDGSLYHTVRKTGSTIDPYPPDELASDVSGADMEELGSDDLAIVTVDAAGAKLSYTTFKGGQPEEIWSTPDAKTQIAHVDMAVDADGNVHVCFLTRDVDDPLDQELAAIRYLCNAGGAWKDMGSIRGTKESGPNPIMPISLALSRDKYGAPRVHLVYTLYKPVNFYLWYAYYDQGGWHVAEETLDETYTNSFWTYGTAVADGEGNLHIVYSWAAAETERTLMYIRGTPKEPQ